MLSWCILPRFLGDTPYLKTIATEVFKSLNNLNPTFMKHIFEAKTISHDLRNSNVVFQLKW